MDNHWQNLLISLPPIILGFSIHEFAHALTAVKLGDHTPKEQGRLSLNPLVHLEFLGILMMILVGFGWAKPVQFNPYALKNQKSSPLYIALAGPLANLIVAIFFAFLYKFCLIFTPMLFDNPINCNMISTMFDYFVYVNLALFIFNLIPIPPLDGSYLITTWLPDSFIKDQFIKFGNLFLLFLIIVNRCAENSIFKIENLINATREIIYQILNL